MNTTTFPMQNTSAVTDANKQLVMRHFNEVINQKQLSLIPQLFAENFYSVAPNGDIVTGRDHLAQYLGNFFTAFPDLHITLEDILAEDDKVAARVTVQGTHQGVFWGIAPTNRQISIQEVFMVKVANNFVIEARPIADLHSLLQQLTQN
ncbi:ester cyclase [Rhodocytophaga rosea]|uniref:Ester cyclase n=1 Tax=Rhodocytophaga rosea TaxID=2704465 RepID=A0A6C0GKI6_9BACT|nr:ester cyclase [Rhodocytophaga rosea]QHT68479.1 ester cyclase [Rhodocytophaga rosea]